MEYCCCCIGSDGEGPSRRCVETPGGRQDRGSYARGEEGEGSAKAAASGSSKPVPAAKPAAAGHSKTSASAKAAASGGSKPPPCRPVKGRRSPSLARRVADFGTDISVDDYFVGK
jgi:pyruvate/2-oxoglutarate dehydrogenase complex dihydrolipoamide acyltransferase (E2) component